MKYPLKQSDPLLHARYSQLKQDIMSSDMLLPGSPGSLQRAARSGEESHWYRYFTEVNGKPAKQYVGPGHDLARHDAMQQSIDIANSVKQTVISLRKDGYQVLPKDFARVMVELFNRRLIGPQNGTLILTGTLAFMAILNENGLLHASAKTLDLDLAYDRQVKLGVSESLEEVVKAALEDIVVVPAMPSHEPSTSLKRRGLNMLSVDLLTEGAPVGKAVPVLPLRWHAQAIPHLQYLIADAKPACVLAGHQGIICRVPDATRFALTKLYVAKAKTRLSDKALKDWMQATLLLSWLMTDDPESVAASLSEAPADIKKSVIASKSRLEEDGVPNLHVLFE